MNPLLKLILFIIALLFCSNTLYAQSEQLDRDIRIAERIIQEIFTPAAASGERHYVLPAVRRVESEYIPGIGVHFRVGQSGAWAMSLTSGNGNGETDQSSNTGTNASVENRMLEYLMLYAGQLRGLPANEQVRITFGARSAAPHIVFYSASGERRSQQPGISMWVSKADIDRFAEGNLSENQFKSRISKHEISESQEKRDLNIFASVLEGALNSTDSEYLRVNRKPRYEYLPGLGVHFQVNVNSGMGISLANVRGFASQIDDLNLENVDIKIDLGDIVAGVAPDFDVLAPPNDSLRIALRKMSDSLRVQSRELRGQVEILRNQAEEARRQGQEIQRQIEFRVAERDTIDLSADAEKIMIEIKAAIKDYGSTLSSLNDNELLMITVHWSGRNTSIPEKTHVRIKKSDMLRGSQPAIEDIRRR